MEKELIEEQNDILEEDFEQEQKLRSLSADERETHLTISDNEPDYFNLYTTQRKMMRHLKKIGLTPYNVDKIDGEIVGESYKVPVDQVLIRKERKKVEYSEERREQLREHMKNVHEQKK